MGLVETVLGDLSLKKALVYIAAGLFIWHWVDRLIEHYRIRRIGKYGRSVFSWAPYGMSSYDSPLHEEEKKKKQAAEADVKSQAWILSLVPSSQLAFTRILSSGAMNTS